jgi:molybdopterin-binding protein
MHDVTGAWPVGSMGIYDHSQVSRPAGWTYRQEEAVMKLSARNMLKGTVVSVNHGVVNTEVVLQLPGGEHLVSIITKQSAENLGLKEGAEAYAVIKASNVMMAVD